MASTSAARARLLTNAGIPFEQRNPGTDESALKRSYHGGSGAELAALLAGEKALAVSSVNVDRLTIGADQILICDGAMLDKPVTLAEAKDHLLSLAGKTHTLETAAAAYMGGELLWVACTTARLTMRKFSTSFLDAYLSMVGKDALTSVGAYKLESVGSQLFEKVEGDYFSILGLPLLELMTFLRARGILAS